MSILKKIDKIRAHDEIKEIYGESILENGNKVEWVVIEKGRAFEDALRDAEKAKKKEEFVKNLMFWKKLERKG